MMSTKNNLQQHLAWFRQTRPYLSESVQIPSSASSYSSTQTAVPSTLPSQRTAFREAQTANPKYKSLPTAALVGRSHNRVPEISAEDRDFDDDFPEWGVDHDERRMVAPASGFFGTRQPSEMGQLELDANLGTKRGLISLPANIQRSQISNGGNPETRKPQSLSSAYNRQLQSPTRTSDLNISSYKHDKTPTSRGETSFSQLPSSLANIMVVDLTESPENIKRERDSFSSKRKSDDFGDDRPAKRQSIQKDEVQFGRRVSRSASIASDVTGDIDDFDFDDIAVKESTTAKRLSPARKQPLLDDWDDFKENDFIDVDFGGLDNPLEDTTNKLKSDDLLYDELDDEDFDLKPRSPTLKPQFNSARMKTPTRLPKPNPKLWGYPWSNDVKYALKDTFGLNGFRENQLEAINATLGGKNAFVLMPTGGGKSLCYQLPAIIRSGTTSGVTIVISPLLSLMQDQVDHLKELNIKALLVNGETPANERREILDVLKRRDAGDFIELIYITPEMMTKNQQLMRILSNLCTNKQLARIVIDEAHCVSQWGHDFRPDYKSIGQLKQQFVGVPTIALTATATENVKLDVMHNLHMDNCEVFTQSFNRSNLTYVVKEKPKANQLVEEMARIIKTSYKNQTGIIYCLSRANCEKVAEDLRKQHHIRATHYHAGMDSKEKAKTQREWQAGRCKVIVATIAFGMGIDKPDVRFVIHHTIPKSLEGYYQETGRAGRDGNPSNCYLFYGRKDSTTLKRMIYDGEGSQEQKDRQIDMLQRMISYCENRSDCRRSQILEYFSERFDRAECNGTCDNCKSDKVYVKCDLTSEAKAVARVVRAMQANQCTLAQCIEVFRGGRSKRIIDAGFDQLPEHGTGSGVEKSSAERLFYLLIQMDVLEEKTTYNRAGFPQAHIQIGRRYSSFMNSSERIVLNVSATPKKPGPRNSTVDKAFNKKKSAGSRTGVGTTTTVIGVEGSSPVRKGRRRKSVSPDSSDAFEDAGSLKDFVVGDSVDEYEPQKKRSARTTQPPANKAKQKEVHHDQEERVLHMREDAIESFLIDVAVRVKQIEPILKKDGELCTNQALRQLWDMKPQTTDDLMIEGVDPDFANLLGYELLNRIKESTTQFELNRDEATRNVVEVIIEESDEEELVTSQYFDEQMSQPPKAEVEDFWSHRWEPTIPPKRELPFTKQSSTGGAKSSQSKASSASRRNNFARRGRGWGFKKRGR